MANPKLNPDQENACNTIDISTLVVAGPGSGKTKTLSAKASAIFAHRGDARILAVTFTRDSAEELRERILKSVGHQFADQVTAGTFHSLAIEQLRAAKLMPRIISEPEQQLFYKMAYEQVAEAMHFDQLADEERVCFDDAVYLMEGLKRRFDHEQAAEIPRRLLKAYNDLTTDKKVIDLQEVLMRCVRGMRDGSVKPLNVTDVFVDEFQDTDLVQYTWLYVMYQILGRPPYSRRPVFTAVGDDDQSIYGWRHAMGYQGMMRYQKEFSAKVITFGLNYRSRTEIVRAADQLISNNANRVHKRFDAAKGQGGSVQILRFPNKEAEVKHIATLIAQATRTAPGAYTYEIGDREWAVLARNRWLLNKMETALLSFGIPYVRTNGDSFWDRQEVVVFLGLIRTVTGQYNCVDQVLSWSRVSSNAIGQLKKSLGGKLSRLASAQFDKTAIQDSSSWKIEALQCALKGMHNALSSRNEELALCIARDYMADQAETNRARSNINLAAESIQRLKGTLARRLAYIAKATDHKDEEAPCGVNLFTLHSSKGLEWNNVVIIGCEEKVIPSEQALAVDPTHKQAIDAIAEERRLIFVGMTRPMDRLILTYSIDKNERSRFLSETGVVV